ncbi:RHS repeat-associated core domain-containing protein, partial [Sulfidibacter corallicola]
DACADPDGDGLFRAWPVFAQRYTYSHLQDYRDVDLSLTDEATGFTTMFIDDLPTTGTDEGELAEARLPHEAARPFLFEREPPTTGGFMAWQMTGDPLDSQAGPVFGPKRLLPYKFLIGGVGVIVPGETEDERARGYETDYELVLEEDPVGDADTSCNAINRKLGFQLNHEATRVRFSLGDRVLYDGVPLPPGQYESSHDFLTPGLFEWTFEADFRDGARNTYTLTRSGTIDIVKRVRKRMAIGSTVVRGVNLNSGSLNVGSTDLHIPGLNGGLAFTRSYSSGGGQNYNPLGIGWIHNYQSRLVEGGCDILQVVGGDGSGQDFQRHSDGQYRPAMPGVHSRLEANAYGGYTLITKSGRAYVYGPPLPFDPGGEAPFTFGQNLRFIEDSFGNRTVIRYDDLTRQIREVQEPAGRKLVFSYDYSGFYPLLTSITTEGVVPAITVHFAHDADGRLVQVTRDERVERYQYTRACEGHRLTQFTNPNGFETAYVYYAPGELPDLAVDAGWIKEIREPEGLTTRFVYWDQGNGITGADVSDDLSTTSYQFNLNGQPIQITGPLGTKRMTWTEGDVLLLSETDEAGRSFSYGYDANGNTTLKRQDGVMEETWTYHPLWNKPLTYTDPRGNTTTWDLDEAMGAVLAVNDAMGNRTEFGYDARGLLETVTDPRGHETSYTYDDLGYAQTQTLADGNVVRTTYDSRGRLRSSRDSADRNTSYRYDHLDRLLSETSTADQSGGRLMQYFDHLPMGQPQRARDGVLEIEYGYDELNRAVTLTLDPGEGQPRMQRDLTYDIHGNPIQEVWSGDLGMTKTFVRDFDPADRLERETLNGQFYSARTYREGTELVASITDWRGAVTQASYDPKLHLDALTLATGHQLDFDYDVAGNRIREVDGNGHVTSYSYDPLNRVAFKVDPLGHRTEYDYDASGNLLGWRNRTTGAGETQQFDELNRVVRHTSLNPAGSGDQVRSYAYLQHGRRVIETLPEDLPITVEMNQLGQTTAMSQGDIVERYHYNANHGVVRVEHPERFETLRQVDGMGRVVEERAPHDYLTRHRYDIYGNLVEATDPRGIQTQISYDRFDRPLTRQSSHATGTITAHWSYSQSTGRTTVVGTDHRGNTVTGLFDELGRLLEQTDTARGATRHQSWDAANLRFARDYNGNETHFHYDGLNRLIWQRDAGGEIRTAYDDEHLTVQTVDRRGITTVAGFDQLGNLLTRSRAGIRLETNQYDRQNRVLVQTDAEGIAHRTSYDAHGRLARQAVGDQVTQFRQYNQLGYPGEVHDGRVSLFQTHDFYGRVVSTTNELDEQVRMAYDPAGNLTLRDAPSPTGERARTQYAYDLLNNLRQVIEPNGAETRYDWNPTWTEQTVTDAEQVVSAWTYDLAGRLTAIQHPGLGVTGFGYDANDNRTSVERPIGSATFGYDYRNRVMDETWEGNAHADAAIHSIDRERDANGNLTRVRQIGSEGTYERHIDYDDLDRPYQFSDSRGLGHTIGYYDNGTRESVTDARGFTVRYTYDPANRLETAVVDGQGVARFGYHANGLPEEISLPNGTRTAYAFDRANRPTELGHERPDGSATRYHATYHADGSRASLVEDRGDLGRWETTYRYDINSRLTEWTRTTPQHRRTTSLSLDRVGNRTYELEEGDGYARERAYSYQPGHQISGFTETTREDEVLTASRQVLYDYDANGNRTAKTDVDRLAKRATATRMRWDARDRLRRVEHDGIEALNFAYDDLDRRIRKWGDSRQGSAMLYTWDELAVLSEHEEGAGAGGDPLPLASYAFAGQRLAIERVGVGVQWFHHDPLGSVAELTDAAGALVEAKTFDPWGREEQVFASAAGGYNRYGFTGHEYDPETELTYAKARYYDQDLGVFASMDRWDFAQFDRPPSLHRYQYASRNPLAFIDPTGNNDVSLDGFMDLVHDANANIQIAQTSVQKSVMGLLKGALSVVVEGAEETVKMALDLGMTNVSMTHYALTGEFIDFQMQSAIGKGSEQGMTHGDLFNGVVTGVANLPVEYGKAIASGDPERIGKATTNLISVMWGFRTLNPATLKAGVTQGVSRVTRGVKASAKIVKEGVEKTATVAKRVKQGAKVTLAKAKGAATTAGRVARIYGRQFGRELMKPRLGSLGGNFQSAIDAGVRVASRIKSGKILSRRKISRNNYQIKKRGIHGRRILNIGAGDNPMPRAINADIRDVPGVDVVADANKLPFSTNHFDKVFAHNPFGFNPVTGDVARVLKPGGTMTVTGQPRNPFFRQFVDKLSKEELRKMGFEKISHGSIVDDLILGTPKTTTGKPLDTSVMIQVTLRKL